MTVPSVSGLRIYPIKSLRGVELDRSQVEKRGLRHDRRWMLVDEEGMFLTQRRDTRLALFRTFLTSEGIRVASPAGDEVLVPYQPQGRHVTAQVWNSVCDAIQVSEEIDTWFSERLDLTCSLVHMPDSSVRATSPTYTQEGDMVGFADAFQVLVAGESSLEDLNGRLEVPLPMNRFRPNIIVRGSTPFEEDEWPGFEIDGVSFRAAKGCARCSVTATDQETGVTAVEPLRTLATYRRRDQHVYFGSYFVPEISEIAGVSGISGEIAVGSSLLMRSTLSV